VGGGGGGGGGWGGGGGGGPPPEREKSGGAGDRGERAEGELGRSSFTTDEGAKHSKTTKWNSLVKREAEGQEASFLNEVMEGPLQRREKEERFPKPGPKKAFEKGKDGVRPR